MKIAIKDLFNKEEAITLNLKNMHNHLRKYREEVCMLQGRYPSQANSEKMKHFKKIFKFYDLHLIPVLKANNKMERRHIAVIKKNPDPEFQPIDEEVKHHQDLNVRFRNRFEQMHKQFYTYTLELQDLN